MTQPAGYELYRVITDYEALQEAFVDRIEDLGTTLEQIELAGEMARGQLQKCLTKNPGKAIARPRDHRHASNQRKFGWESLGKALKGTGLALVLVVDDERFAPIKVQLAKRKRPRQANAKQLSTAVLADYKRSLFRKNGAMGGKRRLVKLSRKQRNLIAKAGAKARWSRKRTRKKGALSAASLSTSSQLSSG